MPKQLTLDLGHRSALGRDDFLLTDSNAEAVALIDQWPHWPSYGAVIVGPAGSGKTHLAEVWRAASGATAIAAELLDDDAVHSLTGKKALVVDNLVSGSFNETVLFHLLNHMRHSTSHILLIAPDWPVAARLADLSSRLNALPVATIRPPDDELLRGVLVKLFQDRQIPVEAQLINYLVSRMPRSLEMARDVVERIDATAMEHSAEVTRVLAGKVLASLENPDLL